ncbi:MAG: LLM class flavin-dependent oxidoreductase [SAR202 cluster bacterium]|nr:LLM class flavin-dependent oxidoreductase [SAR202 cluster bacterium]
MEVGYFAMPLHPPGADFTKTVHEDIQQLVTLDRLGYHEAWIGEHFTMEWENIPSPELVIAMALAKTKRIKLGTGVTCLAYHNPFHLAHRIAELDHLAKGRFQWGIGTGASPMDFEVFGVDAEKNEQRWLSRETVDMVLKIWEGAPLGTYENKFWRVKIPPPMPDVNFSIHLKPYQKPHPPIAVAGLSPRSDTLIMAGERGWIPMSINHTPAPTLKTHWEAVLEGAKRTGRTPGRSQWRIARDIFIADTAEEARREAIKGTMARDYYGYVYPVLAKYGYLKLFKSDPEMPDSAVTLDYIVDNIWVVGSVEDVVAKLRKLYKDVGGFGVLLAMHHEWKPRAKWLRSMELLVNEVIPALADLR